jgi:hypothetical protein
MRCLLPVPAGLLLCPAVLHNIGNMRIEGALVAGVANNCSRSSTPLLPDEKLDCAVWKNLTEQDFIQSTFVLSATSVLGAPKGQATLVFMPETVQVANHNISTALMSVSVAANTTSVSTVGQTVLYTVTLVSRSSQTCHAWAPA